jgi:Na+/proline symporter
MSTIGTNLNWGASYLVNDFYRRFLRKDAGEHHYVAVSQVATVFLTLASATVTYFMDTIAGAWTLLMAVGAGTGGVLILRWYWWRINAWSEVSAMAASLIVSLVLQWRFGLSSADPVEFAHMMLITVGITTATWLAVTYVTSPEPMDKLVAFYRLVRPSPALWKPVALKAPDVEPSRDARYNLLDWVAGCVMIYGLLFGVGKIILKDFGIGVLFVVAGLAAGAFIYWDLSRRGWGKVLD